MKLSAKGKKASILIIISFTLLILATFSFAEFVSTDIIKSPLYDNGEFFSSGDYQSFYVSNNATLKTLSVIGKANENFAITFPILRIYENNASNQPENLVYSTVATSTFKTYFSELKFNLNNLNLSSGNYWILLTSSGGQDFYYSDISSTDTYLNGGINNISSSQDLYFIFSGNFIEAQNTNLQNDDDYVNQILGEDNRILLLAGIGILIGLILTVAQYIKHDFFILLISILGSVLLFLIGILNFYIVGFFIVADIISFMYGVKNEN